MINDRLIIHQLHIIHYKFQTISDRKRAEHSTSRLELVDLS